MSNGPVPDQANISVGTPSAKTSFVLKLPGGGGKAPDGYSTDSVDTHSEIPCGCGAEAGVSSGFHDDGG